MEAVASTYSSCLCPGPLWVVAVSSGWVQRGCLIAAGAPSAPPERLGITHWSARFMAAELGVSFASVARIWRKWNIQPHRVETFKFSTDPELEVKVRDVVGLYLAPPDNAVVVSVDEKSQIQALDRTAPMLPLRPGLPARATYDYKRNGTTTLCSRHWKSPRAGSARTPAIPATGTRSSSSS